MTDILTSTNTTDTLMSFLTSSKSIPHSNKHISTPSSTATPNNKIQLVEQQLIQSMKHNQQLTNTIKQLQNSQQLQAANSIAALSSKYTDAQYNELQLQCDIYNKKHSLVQQQCNEQTQQITLLTNQLAAVTNDKTELQQQLLQLINQYNTIDIQHKAYRAQCNELKSQLRKHLHDSGIDIHKLLQPSNTTNNNDNKPVQDNHEEHRLTINERELYTIQIHELSIAKANSVYELDQLKRTVQQQQQPGIQPTIKLTRVPSVSSIFNQTKTKLFNINNTQN